MPITLEQTNTSSTWNQQAWTNPQSITIPGGYTTKAGDVIVLMLTNPSNNLSAATASGCGATWTSLGNTIDTRQMTLVGVGCTAGGTTISVAGLSGGFLDVDLGITVWSGLGTLVGSPVYAQGTSNITSGSLSYSKGGILIVGMQGNTNTAVTWSSGLTNNQAYQSANFVGSEMDYAFPSASGSTTSTCHFGNSNSRGTTTFQIGAAPASQGNMLAVMGL